MEYAKDIVFNIKYDDNSNIIRLKKEGNLKRILVSLYENKFILAVLGLTISLIVADTILLTSFMGLLSKI